MGRNILDTVLTCDEMLVSNPLSPDSREPTRCIKVAVSNFNMKVIWLAHKTSTNPKYAFVSWKMKEDKNKYLRLHIDEERIRVHTS